MASNWQTCKTCGKKLNGYTALGQHRKTEHPGEWFAQAVAGAQADFDSFTTFLSDYDAYHTALRVGNLSEPVERLIKKRLSDWPFEGGKERIQEWAAHTKDVLDAALSAQAHHAQGIVKGATP